MTEPSPDFKQYRLPWTTTTTSGQDMHLYFDRVDISATYPFHRPGILMTDYIADNGMVIPRMYTRASKP